VSGLRDTAVERLRRVALAPEFITGRYEVREEIGRGGMGIVYAAFDTELERDVAIKIPAGTFASSVERRLQREARVLARLEHPGIVPIHDSGRLADGRLFYVMKRIRGETLRDYLTGTPTLTDRLRIFERICEPVAFAHEAGIVHRDLKPENVMLGAFGEVLVMDWGLAALQDQDSDDQGTIVGTPGYMAPEQGSREPGGADGRADVFGLGAILYLLLVGSDPAQDAAAAVLRHRETPRALRAICAAALQARPEARYASVDRLAADVAAFRAGEPVSAHRESFIERGLRIGRAYRAGILLVLAYLVMRVAVAVFAGW
jgi:serine/threonine protein kinase